MAPHSSTLAWKIPWMEELSRLQSMGSRDEDTQHEIQELKTAIKWVGDQLTDLQKQVMLKCDWNSTLVQ